MGDKGGGGGGGALHGYADQSKDLLNSLVLVLPLLLVYQAGLFLTQGGILNGADFVSLLILRQWGWQGLMIFNGVIIVAGIAGVAALRQKRRFDPNIIVPVAIESTVYAFLLGLVVTQILWRVGIRSAAWVTDADLGALPLAQGGPQGSIPALVCLALGAGVNEEIVFRLGMFSGFIGVFRKFGAEKLGAVLGAVLVSSVLFSAAHHLGPEPFSLYAFAFRTLAGAIFCVIFAWRGLAVAAYSHAIYDVLVMVVYPLLAILR